MSLNNLFDSLKIKNGPLIHQHTFDLTRLLEEEFYKSNNLTGSGTGGSGLSQVNDEGLEESDGDEGLELKHDSEQPEE